METAELASGPELLVCDRDDDWLAEHLDCVWDRYFEDTPRVNHVDIGFAKRWKSRLGLITLCESSCTTIIRLNGLLSHPVVPECVNTITVAHELVHYAHGFGSPLPRLHRHPHLGNIVEKELLGRGLGALYDDYLDWIDAEWPDFYQAHAKVPRHFWLPRQIGSRGLRDEGNRREVAASMR